MKKFKTLIIASLMLLSISISYSQKAEEKIDVFLTSYEKAYELSGTVLVIEKGKTIYQKAFGFANREFDIPNNVDTKFRIASLTKTFTALVLMRMIEENQLKLNDPVSKYVSHYPSSEKGKIPTIKQLLNHSSGLPHYEGLDELNINWDAYRSTPMKKDSLVKLVSKMKLKFEPGTKHRYSSFGYLLLGCIIEKVSDNTFAYNIDKYINNPLGLKNTGFFESNRLVKNKATGYIKVYKKYNDGAVYMGYEKADYRDQAITFSTGGVHSNLEDLRKLANGFMQNKIVSQQTRKLMLDTEKNWGLGLKVFDESVWGLDYKLKLITMDGVDDGYSSRLSIINDGEIIIIILGNAGRSTETSYITRTIVELLNGKKGKKLRELAAIEIAHRIINEGLDSAIKRYNTLYNNGNIKKSSYYFSEDSFNTLGLRLMRNLGMIKEAIQVFQWNVKMHPKSINPYDSLAEAYMEDGNIEKSTHYYTITLQMLEKEEKKDTEWIDHVKKQLKKLKGV